MKILHVNTYDKGGAATAIKRIHNELLNRNIDSKLLVLHKTEYFPQTYSFWDGIPKVVSEETNFLLRFGKKIYGKLFNKGYRILNKNKIQKQIEKKRELDSLISQVEIFSYPTSICDITEHPLYQEADIIQLNWVSGFLDEPSFFKKNKKPVVWRMPDLYACGGGYHYEKNFLFDELKEEISRNYQLRWNALKDAHVTFVSISNWQKQKADESSLLQKFDKRVIHNGVDLNLFKPMDKGEARKLFNIPLDKTVILFGAHIVSNQRKGYNLLLRALKLINSKDLYCCTFGENKIDHDDGVISMGTIHDNRLLSVLYSAADLFIMPSIEEAFGQVTIETLSCGVPVVSFPTGGSLDIIKNGVNGFLANDFTVEGLAEAIEMALNFRFDSILIRKDIKDRFDIEKKVNEYIDLYNCLIPENQRKN